MSTASPDLITIDASSLSEKSYGIDTTAVELMAKEFAALSIKGVDDKAGYKAVRTARLKLRTIRCDIDTRRKELKAGALEYGKKVDSVAKTLTAIVEPTEKMLEAQEVAIDDEVKAIRQRVINDRVFRLAAIQSPLAESLFADLSDAQFETLYGNHKAIHEAKVEAERVAAEERQRVADQEDADRQAETDRIAAEKQRLAEQEAELNREREALNAQKRAQDETQARLDNEAREAREKIAREEADRVRKENEAKMSSATLEQDRLDAERAEAMKPDIEKLRSYVASLKKHASDNLPNVTDLGFIPRGRIVDIIFDAFDKAMAVVKPAK